MIEDNISLKPGYCKGEIEITIRDRDGNVVNKINENNLVKIFAKELLAHRIPSSQIWDPNANSGSGGWIASNVDPDEEFTARYIIFGGAFNNSTGAPIVNDPRYYVLDPVSQTPVPIALDPGASNGGGLINAIPLADPSRPLKRIEKITYQPTYQPACTPLTQITAGDNSVRAINNIVSLQTTLELDEYNGLGNSSSDFFTITEIALCGGRTIDALGACECSPNDLFLQGNTDGSPIQGLIAPSIGSDIITLSGPEVSLIKQGDQIKLVGHSDQMSGTDSIVQNNSYYLVLQKSVGGSEIQLDRVPVDINNNPISGNVGVYRDTLRIFSTRILSTPFSKSSSFEVSIAWRLIFN